MMCRPRQARQGQTDMEMAVVSETAGKPDIGVASFMNDDIDLAIDRIEAALTGFDLPIPPEALDYFLVDIWFLNMNLTYTADAAELQELLGRLHSLKRRLAGRIKEPAVLIVDLDPILAKPAQGSECWTGPMAQATANQSGLMAFDDNPIAVAVRGASRAAAVRKLTWLLSQTKPRSKAAGA